MRTEAERRGIERAKDVVFVSDNGHGMPQMMEREFPEAHRVTDYRHASDRLKDAARIVHGEGPAAAPAREAMRHELKALLWDGEVDQVIERLAGTAGRFAPRPGKLSELAEGTPARALWTHVFYFEKWKGSMDYPEYRRKGWPIASSSIESACGQFGDRVKHARMRPHAEGGRRPPRGEGSDPLRRRPPGEEVACTDPGAGSGAVHHSRIREPTGM